MNISWRVKYTKDALVIVCISVHSRTATLSGTSKLGRENFIIKVYNLSPRYLSILGEIRTPWGEIFNP